MVFLISISLQTCVMICGILNVTEGTTAWYKQSQLVNHLQACTRLYIVPLIVGVTFPVLHLHTPQQHNALPCPGQQCHEAFKEHYNKSQTISPHGLHHSNGLIAGGGRGVEGAGEGGGGLVKSRYSRRRGFFRAVDCTSEKQLLVIQYIKIPCSAYK